jgi:hypothetical protein
VWTRPDGRAVDATQLQADKTICQGKMEEAERIIHAQGLMPIPLPGQESASVNVYNGCMAEHGYVAK